MNIQKTLSRATVYNTFFRILQTDYTICSEFTEKLSGEKLGVRLIARFTLATKNPKKKGFRKVVLDLPQNRAFLGGETFQVIWKQIHVLGENGIKGKQTVWMKVELA